MVPVTRLENFFFQIADFGFAASGRDTMMCHSIVGSNTYMAPEVIQRRFNFAHDDDPGYDGRKVCTSPRPPPRGNAVS